MSYVCILAVGGEGFEITDLTGGVLEIWLKMKIQVELHYGEPSG